MHGKQRGVALDKIGTLSRESKRYSDNPESDGIAEALLGMSDDNQALFGALANFVAQRIDSLSEEMTKQMQSLALQTQTEPKARMYGNEPKLQVSAQSSPQGHYESPTPMLATIPEQAKDTSVTIAVKDGGTEAPKRELSSASSNSPGDNPQRSPSQSQAMNAANMLQGLENAAEEAEQKKKKEIIKKLKNDMEIAEGVAKQQREQGGKAGKVQNDLNHFLSNMTTAKKDNLVDCVVSAIIIVNAIVIGFSMDDEENDTIFILNVIFTCCFIIELGIKFYLHGIVGHFTHISNWFDFCIVFFDILQISLEIGHSDLLSDAPAASMFRVARLVRLVRLIRLARLQMLDDLVALISGMVGGLTTLLWSIALFFLILYVTALLFREFFGKQDFIFVQNKENMRDYFDNVPRCMFTVFRFFFGDFSTVSGESMFEGIQLKYGAFAAAVVCIFFFMITIGLFNVIAAIFVESTLAAAKNAQDERKTERMNDEVLWATRVALLVRKVFEFNGNYVCEAMSAELEKDEIRNQPIPQEIFTKFFLADNTVQKALNDLEIEQADHKYLFDILDNDNTGSIFITQLADGLERLRGDPRRSDIICVDLMVRSIQQQTDFLVEAAKANVKSSTGNRQKMQENRECLSRIEMILRQLAKNVENLTGVVSTV